jgi:hypothetical protein
MYFLIVVLIPICLCILIAYLISQIGKKKQIGFGWTFYFTLVEPLVGIILAIFSKPKDITKDRYVTIKKISSIILIILGLGYLWGGLTTAKNTAPIDVSAFESKEKVHTGNKNADLIINDSAKTFICPFVGGISYIPINLFLNFDDYRMKAYFRLHDALILLSIGFYILKGKKNIPALLKDSNVTQENNII